MQGNRILMVLLGLATVGATALMTLIALRQPPADVVAMQAGAHRPDVSIPLPAFALTDQTGRPFGLDDLRGKVWVADFIFTRCGGTCPRMSQGMSELQQKLQSHPRWSEVRLVSISVDPEHDTPEVLTQYGKVYGAGENWRFLTGDRETIWRLVGEGFKQSVFDNYEDPAMPIGHSSKFIVVDRAGNIRGMYTGIDSWLPDGSQENNEREALVDRVMELLGE